MLKDIMENISHPNVMHIERVFQVRGPVDCGCTQLYWVVGAFLLWLCCVSVLLKRGIVHTIAELCGIFPTCALRTRPVVVRHSLCSVVRRVVQCGAVPVICVALTATELFIRLCDD
jgi:hypothetical protein